MCGIAGFVNAVGRDAARINRPAILDSMCKVITHRGPDEQGTRIARNAALGMRRLSIIDLVGGQQPIAACDDRLFVVFNGEIYNYRILREELESLGHRFKTKSDTEVIVHAYEEYGVECVQRLRGMFVFAIWDDDSERLFLARDRAGK